MENTKGIELRAEVSQSFHFETHDLNELQSRIVQSVGSYNNELTELQNRFRSCIIKQRGTLPNFNKRHFIQLINRIQKKFEEARVKIERSWHSPLSIQGLLTDSLVTPGYALAYVAYVETLHEMRRHLKEISEIEDDFKWLYSPSLLCERALIPLQYLTTLKWRLRQIIALEDDDKNRKSAEHNLDLISGILDRCYEVLSILHSAQYVGDLDKILDFNIRLSSLHSEKNKKGRKIEYESDNEVIDKRLNSLTPSSDVTIFTSQSSVYCEMSSFLDKDDSQEGPSFFPKKSVARSVAWTSSGFS